MVAILAFVCFELFSCKKYLDEKPRSSLAIATNLSDYQALLEQPNIINDNDLASGEVSAGDIYMADADYLTRAEEDQRMYTWQNSNVFGATINDWFYLYQVVYRANTVIEGAGKMSVNTSNPTEWKDVIGQGYYHRAKAFLNAIGNWAPAYGASSGSDLGIPLKLSVNFNDQSTRATVANCYAKVVADLKVAISHLPNKALHVMRPSKPAAYGLMARTMLMMGDYEAAAKYADSCLSLKSDLIDFNSLTASATFPVPVFNAEVLTASKIYLLAALNPSRAKVVPELYSLYEANDLRKTVFFKNNGNGTYSFKGSYDGSAYSFGGIATDEVYLTRAECRARLNQLDGALADLNALLVKRYKTGTFLPVKTADKNALLTIVLNERRKELLLRGVRWLDIKRLNRDGANISLKRTVSGKDYILNAGSARFSMPIPEVVIELSGMPQNQY